LFQLILNYAPISISSCASIIRYSLSIAKQTIGVVLISKYIEHFSLKNHVADMITASMDAVMRKKRLLG